MDNMISTNPQPLMLNRLRAGLSAVEMVEAMCLEPTQESYNPGAYQVITVLSQYDQLGFLAILFLDCVQIYGSDLYTLYTYGCQRSGSALMRLLQEKMVLSDQGVSYVDLRAQLMDVINSAK